MKRVKLNWEYLAGYPSAQGPLVRGLNYTTGRVVLANGTALPLAGFVRLQDVTAKAHDEAGCDLSGLPDPMATERTTVFIDQRCLMDAALFPGEALVFPTAGGKHIAGKRHFSLTVRECYTTTRGIIQGYARHSNLKLLMAWVPAHQRWEPIQYERV